MAAAPEAEEMTAGPWDVMEGKTLLHIETANMNDGKPCGMPVCSIPKKRRADARAISAVPDLISAMRSILQQIGEAVPLSPECIEAARAALCKATKRP